MANKVFACVKHSDFIYFLLTPAWLCVELLIKSDMLTSYWFQQVLDSHLRGDPHSFAPKVGCSEKEIGWAVKLVGGKTISLSFFPFILLLSSLFLPHFFLLGAYIWKAVYSSTEMSRLEVQGKRICEYFDGNFHTYKIEHSGQCYKYRYYRVCLNPCSF